MAERGPTAIAVSGLLKRIRQIEEDHVEFRSHIEADMISRHEAVCRQVEEEREARKADIVALQTSLSSQSTVKGLRLPRGRMPAKLEECQSSQKTTVSDQSIANVVASAIEAFEVRWKEDLGAGIQNAMSTAMTKVQSETKEVMTLELEAIGDKLQSWQSGLESVHGEISKLQSVVQILESTMQSEIAGLRIEAESFSTVVAQDFQELKQELKGPTEMLPDKELHSMHAKIGHLQSVVQVLESTMQSEIAGLRNEAESLSNCVAQDFQQLKQELSGPAEMLLEAQGILQEAQEVESTSKQEQMETLRADCRELEATIQETGRRVMAALQDELDVVRTAIAALRSECERRSHEEQSPFRSAGTGSPCTEQMHPASPNVFIEVEALRAVVHSVVHECKSMSEEISGIKRSVVGKAVAESRIAALNILRQVQVAASGAAQEVSSICSDLEEPRTRCTTDATSNVPAWSARVEDQSGAVDRHASQAVANLDTSPRQDDQRPLPSQTSLITVPSQTHELPYSDNVSLRSPSTGDVITGSCVVVDVENVLSSRNASVGDSVLGSPESFGSSRNIVVETTQQSGSPTGGVAISPAAPELQGANWIPVAYVEDSGRMQPMQVPASNNPLVETTKTSSTLTDDSYHSHETVIELFGANSKGRDLSKDSSFMIVRDYSKDSLTSTCRSAIIKDSARSTPAQEYRQLPMPLSDGLRHSASMGSLPRNATPSRSISPDPVQGKFNDSNLQPRPGGAGLSGAPGSLLPGVPAHMYQMLSSAQHSNAQVSSIPQVLSAQIPARPTSPQGLISGRSTQSGSTTPHQVQRATSAGMMSSRESSRCASPTPTSSGISHYQFLAGNPFPGMQGAPLVVRGAGSMTLSQDVLPFRSPQPSPPRHR